MQPGNLIELLAPFGEPVELFHKIEGEFIARHEHVRSGLRMMAALERDLLARAARRRGWRDLRVA